MIEYVLYYLLVSLVVFLLIISYGRHNKDPMCGWDNGDWSAVLAMSFIPVIGLIMLFFVYIGPALVKERTLKRNYLADD